MKATPDSVRSYLNEIGRIPMLTSEQEITLGRKVQKLKSLLSIKEKLKVRLRREPTYLEWAEKANCSMPVLERDLAQGKEAKNHFVVANLRLAVAVAKKFQKRGLEFLDLIQEGNTGLIVAAERFDPKRGYKFSTYAYWWIRQAIVRAIQHQSRTIRLPPNVYEKLNKIKKNYQKLTISRGRTPTVNEIAEYSQLNPEEVRFYLKASQTPCSLDQKVGENRDSDLGELLADSATQPLEILLEKEKPERIAELLKDLKPQERKVLVLYYGLSSEPPQTCQKIATQFGITRQSIGERKAKAIAQLKETWKDKTASYF